MPPGLSTAEANTDTAKTQLEKTRPDLKQAPQVEPRRSERLVHSNKRAGYTPIGIVTAQVFRVEALQMLFAYRLPGNRVSSLTMWRRKVRSVCLQQSF